MIQRKRQILLQAEPEAMLLDPAEETDDMLLQAEPEAMLLDPAEETDVASG